jgi:flagellin
MSLRINTNIEAMDAHRQLMGTQDKLQKSMERLSSGYRINTAADDAAGLAISEKLRAQISGLDQANRNTADAISLVQTAEGQLNEVHSMLQRVRELAVQYKNGTLSSQDQTAIQSEINQLASEIERIGTTAQFNGIPLLNGQVTITFQVGANDGETIEVTTATLFGSAIQTAAFALSPTGSVDISEIDAAIDGVSSLRANYGAV